MQVSRSRLEFDQVPLLQHQNIFLANFYNVYCHNPYIVKNIFFLIVLFQKLFENNRKHTTVCERYQV